MVGAGFIACGKAVIEQSQPGEQAIKEIEMIGVIPNNIVLITELQALPRINPFGVHTLYAVAGINKITIYSSRNELPEDVSFQYYVYSTE